MSPKTHEKAREVLEAAEQQENRMTRGRLLLSLVLLILAGGALSLPPVHWRLIGWWRGEAFFQSRPTSYWEQEIETSFQPLIVVGCLSGERPANKLRIMREAPVSKWLQRRVEPWWNWQRLQSGAFSSSVVEVEAPLTTGDEDAAGVLHQLLGSKSAKSRRVAAFGLAKLKVPPAAAVEQLLQLAAHDPDNDVRRAAARAANHIRWPREVPVPRVPPIEFK
jgi:hypothetical protein